MTLQVAMVGTDGVVLASDTKWSEISGGIRQTSNRTKVFIDESRTIAVSCARAMNASRRIAVKILADTAIRWDSPASQIEEIAREVIAKAPEASFKDANCLIVSPSLHLYRLYLDSYGDDVELRCEEQDKAYEGEGSNSALYWAERYYGRRQIRDLIVPAAFSILAGGRLNPAGIEHLEIILCEQNGFHRLSNEEIQELEQLFDAFDKRFSQGNWDTLRLWLDKP